MAVPTSAADLFDTILPPKIAASPDKAREINAIYQFIITGEGGGQWNVDLASNPPSITQGEKPGAKLHHRSRQHRLPGYAQSPALGMQLFMTGKLKVKGDPMLAMKLQKLFSLG